MFDRTKINLQLNKHDMEMIVTNWLHPFIINGND